jgi:hypothetical protein
MGSALVGIVGTCVSKNSFVYQMPLSVTQAGM